MGIAAEEGRLWRGTAQSARDDERRARLLHAALEIYGTTGYAGATVRAVCTLAHVSTRSFYQLFADQSALLTALYRELNAEVLAGFTDTSIDPSASLRAGVRTLVDAALSPMLADERKARVLEVESVGVSPALERERRRAYRAFADGIDAVMEGLARAGRIDSAPGGLTSIILVGGITEALVQRVQSPASLRTPPERFVDDVTDVIVRTLSASR